MIPGSTVLLGYCDLAAAGARLLHHVHALDASLEESTLVLLGLSVAVRTYADISLVIVRDVVPASIATAFAAALTDLLEGKKVVFLTAPSVPMSSAEEPFVFWTQYPMAALDLPSAQFQRIPLAKWTLNDAFLCACLHFFQVEALPLTVLLVRGYKYTGRSTDGTAEAITKLGSALPHVLKALGVSKAFEVDTKAASVMKMLTMDTTRPDNGILYN
ncbi:hypothetical protein ACHHYP_00693 [Achlya hypogyna]|uniref:Proteasome assembly chaperone 1 n=1 Tax=Achlya hypogyna TaxID=1202772 RepID=A0A1V9ZU09_ACHHY|nr:hypothetical protein ACHHYP_00693 [Achlya hypogyna]